MNAKQKWLAAGEVVNAKREAFREVSGGADIGRAPAAYAEYVSAREVESAAYREFLAELEAAK